MVIPIVTTTEVHKVESFNISRVIYNNPKLRGHAIIKPVKTVIKVSLIANLIFSFT